MYNDINFYPITVSWDKIIKRPECVDKYIVYTWPQQSDVSQATQVYHGTIRDKLSSANIKQALKFAINLGY